MTDLIHGFTPTYEGTRVVHLKFQATFPAFQASIGVYQNPPEAGGVAVHMTHTELLPKEALDGLRAILDHVEIHKELPGRKLLPSWLPTDLPEGWEWKPRSKARPRSDGDLSHWMAATKHNNRLAFWHMEPGGKEWFLCVTRAPKEILEVMQQALTNYLSSLDPNPFEPL